MSKNDKDCICGRGGECEGFSAAFLILQDPRCSYSELPKLRAPALSSLDVQSNFYRECLLRHILPPDRTEHFHDDNDQYFIANHHFHPDIVLKYAKKAKRKTCNLPMSLPENEMKSFNIQMNRDDMVIDENNNHTGDHWYVLPNYSFNETKQDLKKCIQSRQRRKHKDPDDGDDKKLLAFVAKIEEADAAIATNFSRSSKASILTSDLKENPIVDGSLEQTTELNTVNQLEQAEAGGSRIRDDKDIVAVNEQENLSGFWKRESMRMARYPLTYFWVAIMISGGIAVIGIVGGDFSFSANNAGWHSRGTLISDRETQVLLVHRVLVRTLSEGEHVWDHLLNNIQPGWEKGRRLLAGEEGTLPFRIEPSSFWYETVIPKNITLSHPEEEERNLPFHMTDFFMDRMQEKSGEGILEGCDMSWYYSSHMLRATRLWPVWKTQTSSVSALDPGVIRDLCKAEETTQNLLVEKDLCIPCNGSGCLPPFSLVFYARVTVPDGFSMDCETLSSSWAAYQERTEEVLPRCVEDIKKSYSADLDHIELPESCPFGLYPTLFDAHFNSTERVEFTSSIFATVTKDVESLFENVGGFGRGSNLIKGAYDTQKEHFVRLQIEKSLVNDLALSLVSAVVTGLAMLVHTRSPFLTLIGLLQIILSFPLAYFVYTFVTQLDFFPLLNFIGIFVVFALGADDVFVAVDKWKNARIEHYTSSTEVIAALALPDAAGAMFLTTITTAVAFLGTALCPVAPIKCFAIFCGLLVIMDYIMCVLLVFPALCIYDRQRHQRNMCLRCHFCSRCEAKGSHGEEDNSRPSFIRRILLKFYEILHRFRWLMFVVCCAGLAVSIYFAAQMELPTSAGFRLLKADDFQYELNYKWRLNLLSDIVEKEGSRVYIMWGTKPADTGDHNNPDSWSKLVLDEDFNPSNEDVQLYLAGFCDKLFNQEFAERSNPSYVCPINKFDLWLQEQFQSESPDDAYILNCGNATSLPVAQENFDACIAAWNREAEEDFVVARRGVVKIMYIMFNSRVGYTNSFDELDAEWHVLEDWMKVERDNFAPVGGRNFYHSSQDFWWYDTNGQMLKATYGAAAIALGMSAAVILFSSRSLMLTMFSAITIGFILCAVTALLVGFNWTLGFLESICIVVLIGISCDFVIHFTHAYASLPGEASRGERTKYAIVRMGPSILAAAFTTIAAATVMLFTVITFFEKFALILLLTIVMATVGSFLVFVTLVDCIGPSQPTYLVDMLIAKVVSCRKGKTGESEAQQG